MSEIAINQVLSQMRSMAAGAANQTELPVNQAEPGEFSALMRDSIREVNDTMAASKDLAMRFESGDPTVSLAEVMVTAQQASLQFAGLTEVRNKLLTAYQEVMNMQV